MSTSDSGYVFPHGYYAPFATVTSTDHAAWIIIAAAVGLSCILLFTGIRVFMRWTITPNVGPDEWFLGASTLIAVAQSSVILAACAKGLGKSMELISDEALDKVQQMYYVSTILFILSLGLSKTSVSFLLLRLTPQKEHRRVFLGISALIIAWMIASTLTVALQCNLSHPWMLVGETCPRSFLRWKFISAFDIGFELCLVGMTVYLVWGLQTSLETKVTVVFSFGMRLPLIVLISLRLAHLDAADLLTNPTFLLSDSILWMQSEMAYSIIAATIPSLRPFIRTLATNYGTSPTNGYGSGSAGYAKTSDGELRSNESHEMGRLRPKGKGDQYKYRIWSSKNGKDQDRVNVGGEESAIQTPERDGASVGSRDSQRMIIRKDLIWEVAAEAKQ